MYKQKVNLKQRNTLTQRHVILYVDHTFYVAVTVTINAKVLLTRIGVLILKIGKSVRSFLNQLNRNEFINYFPG